MNILIYQSSIKKQFNLRWTRAPDYSQIRNILTALSSKEMEKALRIYSKEITDEKKAERDNLRIYIGIDGKTLRGSILFCALTIKS